ncbi:hypothetical protein ONZ51_g6871 [Trametes cubensis]|uniref:HNH nuclease domain-containing protein n=1 Tax=Trametes cubensis TaxID=1111947 RepID=A0AAD7XAQ3_9APHY|nr:hypothetical protein ONZ51_g6871 [Trametes cubensis]
MTALPPATTAAEILKSSSPAAFGVYENFVLPAESAAIDACNTLYIIQARVVGYLLLYPPSEDARRALTTELASYKSSSNVHQRVYGLGAMYLRHFIFVFRRNRGRTPAPSDDSSPPSPDRAREEYMRQLQPVPRDHLSAKHAALVRDNFRCMLTGTVDMASVDENLTIRAPGETEDLTRCFRIFPDSLGNTETYGTGPKEYGTATVWSILERFGYENISAELGSTSKNNLHRLENVMTLSPRIHALFDKMLLWLETVDETNSTHGTLSAQDNTYKVVLARGRTHDAINVREKVHFVSHHPDLPVPNPRYLQIHATCCRIAHMSGAADYLDLVLRDIEESKVLAEDGTSADTLTFAIHRRLADPV